MKHIKGDIKDILKPYDKTFKDLAAHDRGEDIVPHQRAKKPSSEEKPPNTTKATNPPPHELGATLGEIEENIGFTPKYSKGYWLSWLKKKEISYTRILGYLKEVKKLPVAKRGGALFNKIRNK